MDKKQAKQARDVANRRRLRIEQRDADLKAICPERREKMRDYFHRLMSWPPPGSMV